MKFITFPVFATGLWLPAFLFSFSWFPAYETELVILSVCSLFIACSVSDAAGIRQRQWPVPLSPTLIAGGIFWLISLISLATTQIFFVSWLYFFVFSALPLSILFFLVGHDAKTRMDTAWIGIRLILVALALYALAQYFFMENRLTSVGRVYQPFADPNSLAGVLSLGIFMTVGIFLKKSERPRWHDYLLLLLLGLAFLSTGSRAGAMALMGMMGIFVLLLGVGRISKRTWVGLAVVALVAITGASVFAPASDNRGLSLVIFAPLTVINWGLDDRIIIWQSALQILRDYIWTGTGIGTFQFFYPEVRNIADNTYGYMVHNEPLHFATEMGIFAPIAFYATILLAIGRTCAVLKKIPRGDDLRIDVLAPFLGLGALVLHSHATYNLHVLPCLFLTGYVFARWYWVTAQIKGEEFRIVKASKWLNKDGLEAGLLIVTFVAVTAFAAPMVSQLLVMKAKRDLIGGKLEAFADKINIADTLALGMNAQAYSQAAAVPLGILEQTVQPLKDSEREKFKAEARHLLDTALALNRRDADILIQRADLAMIEGAPEQAEALLREALRIDPLSLPARMALGHHLDTHDKQDEAVEIMNDGLNRIYGPVRGRRYMEYYIQTMTLQEAQERRKAEALKKRP
jgi:O-antigen ligase